MRRAPGSLLLIVFAALASAADATEIHVYRRGKVLGYDKDVGESLNEALIETWSCETGELLKTERVETYFHLSDDGEVLTPRAVCDRCRERFELDKKGSKQLFKGKRKPGAKPAEPGKPEPPKPEPGKPAPPVPAKPAAAAVDSDSLAELEKKASDAVSEIKKIDPREAHSATKRRRIIEDRGIQVGFNEWKNDPRAARAVAKRIEGRIDLSGPDTYYVLRSFGWQRYHEHDGVAAAVFYDRCIHREPLWSSAHYGLALVKRDQKDDEGELLELGWALRAKPKLKYAKLILERMGAMKKPVGRLTPGELGRLELAAENAKAALEKSPPDVGGAKSAVESSLGKLLDDKAPLDRKAGSGAEPDDEK